MQLSHNPTKELASDQRLILAVQSAFLPPAINVTGFHPLGQSSAMTVLKEAGCWFGPRNLLEEMPMFRQVIPYTVLTHEDKILSYKRTKTSGEGRLHSKVSIGVGGHIDITDVNPEASKEHTEGKFDLGQTMREATYREVREEVGDVEEFVERRHWAGILVNNNTPVDMVHIGLVNVWVLNRDYDPASMVVEHALGSARFREREDILAEGNLELWARMLLENPLAWL